MDNAESVTKFGAPPGQLFTARVEAGQDLEIAVVDAGPEELREAV
ncbi:hypothetical protein [Thermanaeromonas toyohensis]|nr:hypothetical protein [Thermanaeromonas toyohensis]